MTKILIDNPDHTELAEMINDWLNDPVVPMQDIIDKMIAEVVKEELGPPDVEKT